MPVQQRQKDEGGEEVGYFELKILAGTQEETYSNLVVTKKFGLNETPSEKTQRAFFTLFTV